MWRNDDLFESQFFTAVLKAVNSYGYLSLETLADSQRNCRLNSSRSTSFRPVEKAITV